MQLLCYDYTADLLKKELPTRNFLSFFLVGGMDMITPTMEEVLYRIHFLIEGKGYARVTEIAETLHVMPSNITKMIQKLHQHGLVRYEKYRGVVLTEAGKRIVQHIKEKHVVLERFFDLIGMEEKQTQEETCTLGNHMSNLTVTRISLLLQFFDCHPTIIQQFMDFSNKQKDFLNALEERN